jgi:hypothetical protein
LCADLVEYKPMEDGDADLLAGLPFHLQGRLECRLLDVQKFCQQLHLSLCQARGLVPGAGANK